jgi:hypothetical protein
MDVLSFIRTLVSRGLETAVRERTDPIGTFRDLVWGREDSSFSLGLEVEIPDGQCLPSGIHSFTQLRYDVSVRADPKEGGPLIDTETVALLDREHAETLTTAARIHTHAQYVREDGSPHPYQPVITRGASVHGHLPYPLEINRGTSVLSHLPPEPTGFPAGIWFARLLREGIFNVTLRAEDLRRPSSLEAERRESGLTGANLAGSVFELKKRSPERFEAWIKHLRTALPDLETVLSKDDPEGRQRYVMFRQNGIEVPSWTVSDGTLCLMALTILAYLPEPNQIYLIEEPENAVHPTAVDTIYQSVSSLYDSQVLMASHSPILLGVAKKEQLLCFTTTRGGTQIVPGSEHPILQEWKGEVSLSDLFVAGVLG